MTRIEMRVFHENLELVTEHDAAIFAQAADDVGNVAVRTIAEQGEFYQIPKSQFKRLVPDGKKLISVSGFFGNEGTHYYYDRVQKLRAENPQRVYDEPTVIF